MAKAQALVDRTRDKELKKQSAMEVKDAHKAVSKVAGMIESLQIVLGNPKINLVKDELTDPVKQYLQGFENILANANLITKKEGGRGLPEPKELAGMIAMAKKESGLLSQILLSAAKARGPE